MSRAKVTSYTLYEQNLPHSFDGFKIAHISDLHSNPAEGTIELIEENAPDITVITGDIVDDDDLDYDKVLNLIKKITCISPVYAVTGNHDLWRSNRRKTFEDLESCGLKFLHNRMVTLEKNGEGIALFGVDDPFSKIPQVIERNLKEAFSSLPEYDGFKILLFHRANLFDSIKDMGFDLILSGHMHGGQIRLPFVGGVCAPTSAILSKGGMLFPKYTAGIYNCKNTSMIVNRGLCNTITLPRWGNPPEVGIITLKVQTADTI